jgi:Fur family ferric uptake transcriptional regulator
MTHNQLAWEETLTRAGCRVTQQRAVILDAVCAGGGHTTLSDIQARVVKTNPGIDRSTIYRTLKLFVELGIVVSAEAGDDEPSYEVAKAVQHHHLICRTCGHEIEIDEADLAPLVSHLAGRYGFQVETDHLMLFGMCSACRSV